MTTVDQFMNQGLYEQTLPDGRIQLFDPKTGTGQIFDPSQMVNANMQPLYGSVGMSAGAPMPSQNKVNIGGTNYVRGQDVEDYIDQIQRQGIPISQTQIDALRAGSKYDPTYGALMPADLFQPLYEQEVQKQVAANPDSFMSENGPGGAFMRTIGPALGFTGLMSALGVGAAAGAGGEAIGGGAGADSLIGGTAGDTLSGGAAAGTGSMQNLFGNLYQAYADGALTPAGAALPTTGAGSIASAATDPIEAMWNAVQSTGASTAAEAAQQLGFNSVQQMLGSINPSWVTAGATATSALGKLLSGNAGADDYAKLLGSLGSAGLGVLGANAQGNALNDVASKYLQLGAPFRDKLLNSYSPGFDLTQQDPAFKNALDQTSDSVLRKLSTSGNPFENPGGLMQAQSYVMNNAYLPQLNTFRSQLASAGGLGTNTAGTADLSAAGTVGQGLNSVGYGLGQLTNQNDLGSFLRQYSGLLGNSPTRNFGGVL